MFHPACFSHLLTWASSFESGIKPGALSALGHLAGVERFQVLGARPMPSDSGSRLASVWVASTTPRWSKKNHGTGLSQLTALAEKMSDVGCGAIVVVGEALHDDRYLVGPKPS